MPALTSCKSEAEAKAASDSFGWDPEPEEEEGALPIMFSSAWTEALLAFRTCDDFMIHVKKTAAIYRQMKERIYPS